jgi:hypothetical protein
MAAKRFFCFLNRLGVLRESAILVSFGFDFLISRPVCTQPEAQAMEVLQDMDCLLFRKERFGFDQLCSVGVSLLR